MRFEPRRAFLTAKACAAQGGDIAPELSFLRLFRHDGNAVLARATAVARHQSVCPARALVAGGEVGASTYYRALADYLGLPFEASWPRLEPMIDVARAYESGRVRLADSRGLLAPTDEILRRLLRARRDGRAMPDIAITTPDHLAALIELRAQGGIEHIARNNLLKAQPRLSARDAHAGRGGIFTVVALLIGMMLLYLAPRPMLDGLCVVFFVATVFRLLVCAKGEPAQVMPAPSDAALPIYTVLVPLRGEAGMVADLLAALDALDYPPAKLQILILVEAEDHATQAALSASRLPSHLRVVVAPRDRTLRTKPRALNIGLLAARGTLITVYDAEDRPAPDQLRRAAALFAVAPAHVACLQARLAIGNGDDNIFARLFALEYAALFDVYNPGATAMGLPLALGGTSNHFRTAALREVGGWDAWNVTEDADLGLRLARFGFGVKSLDSTTWETAPDNLADWMKQRRRWTKGWMQTFLVLVGDAPRVARQLGWAKSAALAMIVTSLVIGPLLVPLVSLLLMWDLRAGLPQPHGGREIFEATLATSLFVLGVSATLGCGYVGMRARGLGRFRASLPLLLPYQLLISAAAWMGLIDLLWRPYHWHKTPHRASDAGPHLSRSSPAAPPLRRTGFRRWRRA